MNAAPAKTPKARALPNRRGVFTPNRYRVEGEGTAAVGVIELTDREDRTAAEGIRRQAAETQGGT